MMLSLDVDNGFQAGDLTCQACLVRRIDDLIHILVGAGRLLGDTAVCLRTLMAKRTELRDSRTVRVSDAALLDLVRQLALERPMQ